MKALILNSGLGKRMGVLASEHPKCMTEISANETILSRQLRLLYEAGVSDVVITTGLFNDVLETYCSSLDLPINYSFVFNPDYAITNYIYSIYCASEHLYGDDIIMMHGDLVFENGLLDNVTAHEHSCMVVSSTSPLPEKDFKAVLDGGKIRKVGVEFFENAVAAQPLYKLLRKDNEVWLDSIADYCHKGMVSCYAEKALNEVSGQCEIYPFDVKNALCNEIDTPEDLCSVTALLKAVNNRKVYICFSTDIIHSGHISIIKSSQKLGKLIVGVLSDEAVASYKPYPMIPYEERKSLLKNINGVSLVVEQKELSYKNILTELKPDFVVHGDDWRSGFQKPVRDEVLKLLNEYGGELVEFPYSKSRKYDELDMRLRMQLSLPDIRRGSLRKLLSMKSIITVIEAHSGITGLIAEKTTVYRDGKAHQFDAMWVSSLCDSTAKGKPDIELVDMSSRFRTIDDIMEVTTKPIILDGDTGGQAEHFAYNVRTLERMGVSAVIIEDKKGLKKNSLFGTSVEQTQDDIECFCKKIATGKRAQKTKEFMVIARIESLILEKGIEDALQRAYAYVGAGADGIMIHSRKKEPVEIFEFIERFRTQNTVTPVVVVPTSFNTVAEEEFASHGVNVVIYANQLTRSGFPAMQKAALSILENHRAKEADEMCMSINEILTLIQEE